MLMSLPNTYRYRIIFMERNEEDRMRSLHKLLEKKRNLPGGVYSVDIVEGQAGQEKKIRDWLRLQPNLDVVFTSYEELVNDTDSAYEDLCAYFDHEIDRNAMKGVAQMSLPR